MGSPDGREETWFTGLYTAHYAHVVRYGQRRLADPDAAAELAQEVFTIAWRRRREVPDRGLPWLYGVARRLLANQWRARRAAPAIVPIVDEPADASSPGADAGVGVADLLAALATLSDLDREILRLVGWEELTIAEAAAVLDCRRAAAAVRLHRARRRLAAAISIGSRTPSRPLLSRPGKEL